MKSLTRNIIFNIHPASLIISVGAVMSGLTASVIRGGISVFPAIMTLLFAILLQMSGNLYHGYLYLSSEAGKNDERKRAYASQNVFMLRIVANGVGILALTAGMSLFTFIGWIGLIYFIIIALLLHFYLSGPKPIVRTKWSIVFTFLFFGPIAVSGTALTQNLTDPNWIPIAVYSVISGLLAANAHIAVQYLRFEEDKNIHIRTLVSTKGGNFTRIVYLANAIIVCIVLIARPSAVEFVSPWIGIVIGLSLLLSSLWVFNKMHKNPINISRLVRNVTFYQYITVTLVLMIIVMYSIEKFRINVFHFL